MHACTCGALGGTCICVGAARSRSPLLAEQTPESEHMVRKVQCYMSFHPRFGPPYVPCSACRRLQHSMGDLFLNNCVCADDDDPSKICPIGQCLPWTDAGSNTAVGSLWRCGRCSSKTPQCSIASTSLIIPTQVMTPLGRKISDWAWIKTPDFINVLVRRCCCFDGLCRS